MSLNDLEVVDVDHQQRQRLAAARARSAPPSSIDAVEILAVAEPGQRIGQALGADRLEILLQIADLGLRQRQPALPAPCWSRCISRVGVHQRFRRSAMTWSRSLGERRASGWRRDRLSPIAGRHAERVGDQRHHVVDLADHARADLVDPVGGACRARDRSS